MFCTAKEFPGQMAIDRLLVTSGVSFNMFNEKAELVWKNNDLAIDGTEVNDIHDGIIYGRAEQDPPDGWVDFKLSLIDGAIVK